MKHKRMNPFLVFFAAEQPEQGGEPLESAGAPEKEKRPAADTGVGNDADSDDADDEGGESQGQRKIAEAQARLEDARKHSRTWETRAKKNHEELQAAQAKAARLEEELDSLQSEHALVMALSRLGADIAAWTDSRSFMEAASKLDHRSESFDKDLAELVAARKPPVMPPPTAALKTLVEDPTPSAGRGLAELLGLGNTTK